MKKKKYLTRGYLLSKVMDLCMEINTLKSTENKPQAFFEYSPHVSMLLVRVYEHGWRKGIKYDEEFWLYADAQRSTTEEYMNVIEYLERLKDA